MAKCKNDLSLMSDAELLDALVSRRDALIRQLWLVYRDMSDLLEADDFDAADLDLWGKVTAHHAVQSKLGA